MNERTMPTNINRHQNAIGATTTLIEASRMEGPLTHAATALSEALFESDLRADNLSSMESETISLDDDYIAAGA